MSKQEETKKISKKETQKIIFEKISGALSEYKSNLKEKKFVANLRKASKLFATDIVKAAAKQNGKTKKAKKKSATKKTEQANESSPVV
ncbi:MAG: hypothetical protein HC867_07965 [Bacteroidia bacterium]|nr:hypothetical protein [Bacteroidia bacterium]